MKLIVTGSRNWSNEQHIFDALNLFSGDVKDDEDLFIVHGACPTGADDIADRWASCELLLEEGVAGKTKAVRYPANWSQGKKAGPERNRRMIDENLDADYVLAFHLGESRGTRHCMAVAENSGLVVVNLGER